MRSWYRIIIAACWLAAACGLSRAQTPRWADWLFLYTGKPDQSEHRLSRSEARELSTGDQRVGVVTASLIYRDMDGREQTGQGRFYLPQALFSGPAYQVPLIYNAGYELDEVGAARLAAKGFAVCTPHAHPVHPLVRGPNFDLALLHAARGLSWVDPLRVSIQGGSAGGWMTLLLTAESFPVLWSAPDMPPIHWGYNAGYLRRNMAIAGPPNGSTTARMPFLYAVSQIAGPSMKGLGTSFDSPAALAVSPLGHLDTITAPTLALFSTADILVPIDQVSYSLVQVRDPALVPAEFNTTVYDEYAPVGRKRTLLEALSRDQYELFRVSAPAGVPRIAFGEQPSAAKTRTLELPFSRKRPWSVVVVDEGAIEPSCAHTKYQWGADHEPFKRWAESRGVTADQLTAPKLERLMKRIRGEPWRPMETPAAGGKKATRRELMDFPAAERADVLRGLQAFAMEDRRALRLAALYADLPDRLKVLGPDLGDGSAPGVRQTLDRLAASTRR